MFLFLYLCLIHDLSYIYICVYGGVGACRRIEWISLTGAVGACLRVSYIYILQTHAGSARRYIYIMHDDKDVWYARLQHMCICVYNVHTPSKFRNYKLYIYISVFDFISSDFRLREARARDVFITRKQTPHERESDSIRSILSCPQHENVSYAPNIHSAIVCYPPI